MQRTLTLTCITSLIYFACVASVLAHGDAAHEAEAPAEGPAYEAKSTGTRNLALDTVTIKMLVDASNIGSNLAEVGELFLPVESGESVAHQHANLELFYVVEGVLGHEVNGKAHRLEPGEVGIVKPGDTVKHAVLTDVPVKALVIWVPGGEADLLIEHAGFVVVPDE